MTGSDYFWYHEDAKHCLEQFQNGHAGVACEQNAHFSLPVWYHHWYFLHHRGIGYGRQPRT